MCSAQPRRGSGPGSIEVSDERGEHGSPELRMPDMADWNSKIIEEFRANEGKVGGPFEGAPLLLLHTVGAKTGQQRVNPMMYRPVDGGYAVKG